MRAIQHTENIAVFLGALVQELHDQTGEEPVIVLEATGHDDFHNCNYRLLMRAVFIYPNNPLKLYRFIDFPQL